MAPFRRSLRWVFTLAGFALGLATAVAALVARMMIAPSRQELWATPTDVGLDYETAQFPAKDGFRVSGWFVPAALSDRENRRPAVLIMHGWQWNRLGYAADDLVANLTGSKQVNLLRLIKSLHDDGYHVLSFDLRNHGQSAAARPVTFGQSEAKDLLGAVAYLHGRDDVDSAQLGVVGFSMGANAALFALPQTDDIQALIAVQPTTPAIFSGRMAANLFGAFGGFVTAVSGFFYRLFGGPPLSSILPAFAAGGAGDVPVLFIQGTGDAWGSVEDVSVIAEQTPCAPQLLFVNTQNRFDGYGYLLNHPEIASRFFAEHLSRED